MFSFDRAIKLNPKDALAWNNKGYALNKLGKYTYLICRKFFTIIIA